MLTKLFCKAQTLVTEFKNDERGVTAIEYGLIGIAMAVALSVIFASDGSFITGLDDTFDSIVTTLSSFTTETTGSE